MNARPDTRRRARGARQRGGVLAFLAVAMVGILVASGLAIDAGRGYILRAQLSRAVDAAALAAARALRQGTDEARARALAVASANGVTAGVGGATLELSFGTNEFDELTVTVTASIGTRTLLMGLVGLDDMLARSAAVAAVPPIDLVLVLDQSGSLGQAGAWDDLQDAARQFIQQFDDQIDQVGMVSFNARAESHFPLGQPFVSRSIDVIDAMTSLSFTNTGEGLRHAHGMFQGPQARQRSAKVVVFFTDGRPTAFTGDVPAGGPQRTLTAWTGSSVSGFWNAPDPVTIDPTVSPGSSSCQSWQFQWCWGYDKDAVWDRAEAEGHFWADRIRADNVLVYTIGLGDPTRPPSDPLLANPQYLRELANEDHIMDPDQPDGRMYFAPSAGELAAVFSAVASDLLARLSQ